MADLDELSDDARTILRIHLTGGKMMLKGSSAEPLSDRTLDQTREAFRELARAGLMEPISGFVHGPEAHYRVTEAGAKLREEIVIGSALLAR